MMPVRSLLSPKLQPLTSNVPSPESGASISPVILTVELRDRLIAGFCSLWIKPSRLRRIAILFKPSTLLNFHRALVQRKYRMLFSPRQQTQKTCGQRMMI
jgi:hypothetical protein